MVETTEGPIVHAGILIPEHMREVCADLTRMRRGKEAQFWYEDSKTGRPKMRRVKVYLVGKGKKSRGMDGLMLYGLEKESGITKQYYYNSMSALAWNNCSWGPELPEA
jgi:hypothetical protein